MVCLNIKKTIISNSDEKFRNFPFLIGIFMHTNIQLFIIASILSTFEFKFLKCITQFNASIEFSFIPWIFEKTFFDTFEFTRL